MQQLAINTNNIVEVNSLIDAITGEYINDANVKLTVKDMQTGDEIGGAVWPTDMTPVGSEGRYRVVLDAFIELNRNRQYLLDITAESGTEQTRWQTPATAVVQV